MGSTYSSASASAPDETTTSSQEVVSKLKLIGERLQITEIRYESRFLSWVTIAGIFLAVSSLASQNVVGNRAYFLSFFIFGIIIFLLACIGYAQDKERLKQFGVEPSVRNDYLFAIIIGTIVLGSIFFLEQLLRGTPESNLKPKHKYEVID